MSLLLLCSIRYNVLLDIFRLLSCDTHVAELLL